MVTFNPGESSQSVLVLTEANALVEPTEVFEGILTLLPGSMRINLANDRAMATIVDNSSKTQFLLICLIIIITLALPSV